VVDIFTTFFYCVLLFELNAWKDEWLVAIKNLQEGKRKKYDVRTKRKKSDLVCEQYTNAYKLGANWDGKDF
jgi:hypothetical protein